MSGQEKHFYQFGPFRLDPVKRRLLRDGEPVPLTPKAFDTLLALVEQSGKTVEKDELMRRVWPGAVVEENSLNRLGLFMRFAPEPSRLRVIRGGGFRIPSEDAD